MAFNLQGAIEASKKLPGPKSQHVCAKFVRTFLEYGGMDTSKRPGLARQYVGYLPTIGFSKVGQIKGRPAQAEWTKASAKPGDIAVYQKPGKPSEPGHICFWNGSQWVSDFRQNNMAVYAADCDAYLYRYTGVIDNHPVDIDPSMISGEGSAGGGGGIQDLNTETLAAKCPADIEYKGMWMRYQLQCGEHSPTMREFMNGPGGAAADSVGGFDGSVPTNLEVGDCGVSTEMLQHICRHETGHEFGYSMKAKDLNGYDLGDAKGHKTFGYGLLYHPNGGFMDAKGSWTQAELEKLFLATVKKQTDKVKAWASKNNQNLSQHQIDAVVSAVYNFGPGFMTMSSKCRGVGPMIAANANNPAIVNTWAHGSDSQASKYPGLVKRRQFEAAWYQQGMT